MFTDIYGLHAYRCDTRVLPYFSHASVRPGWLWIYSEGSRRGSVYLMSEGVFSGLSGPAVLLIQRTMMYLL